ncbi:FmdB family zinc ribbon protein [Desulfobacula toluolica]|uniref:Regulatory protein, FmdB family n=1 Tax=Desulfobacula toluolica (strain DSM 7467 / Tol2) TaxID=651182 RepID=K0NN80_DESTT|nr:zinc ribbon domain-containing protein [Desulfobacula toluolica]CCK82050.1 regulatory protein, FmdB family [Desulfobacula toluolica Tol2]
MPIYEFKCSKCEEFFEVIVMGSNDNDIISCPKCESEEFERVISKTNFAMASPSAGQTKGVQTQERQCSSGSCKTYTVPGESR